MDLLVAYKNDPAGHNMAKFISQKMEKDGDLYHGNYFDLIEIDSPTISADWLDEKYDYDGFVFLSKHAAESGTLARHVTVLEISMKLNLAVMLKN